MRRQPERTAQAEIVKLLRMLGASVYVLGTTRRKGDHPGTMMSAGLPDLWVMLPRRDNTRVSGVGMWIEVKAKGGKLSAAQKQFQEICEYTTTVHVVGGLDDVVRVLKNFGWVT